MKSWLLTKTQGPDGLSLIDTPAPTAGAGEVLVRVGAVSLNYRDLMVADGTYGGGVPVPLVPVSDGAGVVEAVGSGVTRVAPGDRVAPNFFPDWVDGPMTRAHLASALGSGGKGMLCEFVVFPESSLVKVPGHLSIEEAACLPCAGVTAWNAAMVGQPLVAGDTVLVQGSGGVSIFALQFARAFGARVIATTGHAAKRARLEALGAEDTIEVHETPDWARAVRRLANDEGADLVVEVGGAGTLAQSLQAIRMGGRIALLGVLSGKHPIDPNPIARKVATVRGILVGSRFMFEAMNAAIETHRIVPVVDRVFGFTEAREAYRHLASEAHVGKVCIRVG